MRNAGALGVLVGLLVACSSGGSSDGAADAGQQRGNPLLAETTCSPDLPAGTTVTTEELPQPPCPPGADPVVALPTPPLRRYTSASEYAAVHCAYRDAGTDADVGDADAGGAAPGIDFTTSDLVAVYGETTIHTSGADRWADMGIFRCGGAKVVTKWTFFTVTKTANVTQRTCQTSCSCPTPPCEYPP